MNARVIPISSLKIYPNKKENTNTNAYSIEELRGTFTNKATVTIKFEDEEYTFKDCQIDVYSPPPKKYDLTDCCFYDANRLQVKHGEHMVDINLNNRSE